MRPSRKENQHLKYRGIMPLQTQGSAVASERQHTAAGEVPWGGICE